MLFHMSSPVALTPKLITDSNGIKFGSFTQEKTYIIKTINSAHKNEYDSPPKFTAYCFI